MKFQSKLTEGVLIKRYKRFLADVKLSDESIITAHCPNSGSMKTCMNSGWKVMLSKSDNVKRKYPYTWEVVHNGACWIGINTHLANKIVGDKDPSALLLQRRAQHQRSVGGSTLGLR